MLEKIIELLTSKFTGIRKDAIEMLARNLALQCDNDDDVTAAIGKLTDEKVNEFVKGYRSQVDKEVSASISANEKNLRKKYDFVEKNEGNEPKKTEGNDGKKTEGNDGNDISAIINAAIAKAIEPFQNEISNLKQENANKSRLQQVNEKLNACKNDVYKNQMLKAYQKMAFADDEKFNEYLTELDSDIAEANQSFANDSLRGVKPLKSEVNNDGVSKAVSDFISSQSTDSAFAGKKI